jgi:hypothetical protein
MLTTPSRNAIRPTVSVHAPPAIGFMFHLAYYARKQGAM